MDTDTGATYGENCDACAEGVDAGPDSENCDCDEDGVVRFAQVIEGPEDALAVVVERIRADPRHDQIRVVVDDAMQAGRRFAGWDMAIERVPPPVFASASEALFG